MIKSIGFKVGFSFTNFMVTQFFYDEKVVIMSTAQHHVCMAELGENQQCTR